MPKCSGHKRLTKEPCTQSAMENGKCWLHGGKTPVGIASASFKHGRHSKDLPTRLAARYQASLADPELLSLRSDISLLDARLNDVLQGVSNEESGELWKKLKEALREYDGVSSSSKNYESDRAEAFGTMRWLINEGYQEWQSWKDIRFILQERKALVDSERNRLKDMQQLISTDRAMVLIAAVTDSIKRNVTDPTALAAISNDLRAIITAEPR